MIPTAREVLRLYNYYNQLIFDNQCPPAVLYTGGEKEDYGIRSDKKAIGVGTAIGNDPFEIKWCGKVSFDIKSKNDKVYPLLLLINDNFVYRNADTARDTDGEGTVDGVIIHEMCHIVQYRGKVPTDFKTMDVSWIHGPDFINIVDYYQTELDKLEINIVIPISESKNIVRKSDTPKPSSWKLKTHDEGTYMESLKRIIRDIIEEELTT
jgi:hypothetical protein